MTWKLQVQVEVYTGIKILIYMDPRAATNKLRVPFFKLARGITRAALAYPAIMIGFYTHKKT